MHSDVVGESSLAIFAVIGLVAFLSVFVAAFIRTMLVPKREIARCGQLVLEDGSEHTEVGGAAGTGEKGGV